MCIAKILTVIKAKAAGNVSMCEQQHISKTIKYGKDDNLSFG
jgi:hypothetical protein